MNKVNVASANLANKRALSQKKRKSESTIHNNNMGFRQLFSLIRHPLNLIIYAKNYFYFISEEIYKNILKFLCFLKINPYV